MAIERGDVEAAVGKVIPTTTNFARGADATESPDSYYAQMASALLSAIHSDDTAVFYLAYLAAARLGSDVEAALALTEALLSEGGLRALENPEHARVTTTAGLSRARGSLARLDAHVVTGSFADEQVAAFRKEVRDYLSSKVAPNIKNGGSRTAARALVRGVLPALEDAVQRLQGGKDRVRASVSEAAALDLRTLISARVSYACSTLLRQMEEELPQLNDDEQAARMESLAAELAAAYAAMGTVGVSKSPIGTVVTGPRDDGFTEKTYKAAVGTASVSPPDAVLAGFSGRIHVSPRLVGTAGQAQDDADDDGLTPYFKDLSVADWTATEVTPGDTLFTYATGANHRVLSIETARLRVAPEMPVSVSGTKWFIVEDPPGTYFEDPDINFWRKYETGRTASTVVASGTRGYYPRKVLASGTGTHVLLSGAAGESDPWADDDGASGPGVFFGPLFSVAGTSWLSDGVSPGWVWSNKAGTLDPVKQVLDDQNLLVTTSFASGPAPTWALLRWADNSEVLKESGAGFLSRGSLAGLTLQIYGGSANDGDYSIDGVLTDEALRLDSSLVHETGEEWRVLVPGNELVDESATFLSWGIVAGDVFHISGNAYVVDAVLSQTRIRFTTAWAEADYALGELWVRYVRESESRVFSQDDGVDLSDVSPVINGYPAVLTVDSEVVAFSRPTPGDAASLDLRAWRPYNEAPGLEWALRAGDWTDRLGDLDASPFGDVPVGTTIALWPGTSREQRVHVVEVFGPDEVRVSGRVPQGEIGIPYAIYDPVYPRHELLYEGARYPIGSIVDGRLKLSRTMPPTVGVGLSYFIVEPSSTVTSNRLSDIEGARQYDGTTGFGAELIGTELKINSFPVRRTEITGVLDLDEDGLNETLVVKQQFEVGRSKVPYEVWAEVEGTTSVVRFPGTAVGASAGDFVAVWSQPPVRQVVSESASGGSVGLEVQEALSGGLSDLLVVVTRGGSSAYAQWLLFDHLLTSAPVPDPSFLTISAFVARAFQDGGLEGDPVAAGGLVSVRNDGDNDDLTPLLDLDVDLQAAGGRYGDLLTLTHSGGAKSRHYLQAVEGSRATLVPELDVAAVVVSWFAERTSISEALWRVYGIDRSLRFLLSILQAYDVDPSPTVQASLALLAESGLDRAVDTLREGNLPGLSRLSRAAASYIGNAAKAVREAGQSLDGSERPRASSEGTTTPLGSLTGAHRSVGLAARQLNDADHARRVSEVSPEDERNRAVYELTGTPVTDAVSEQSDVLPWIAQTGSKKDRLIRDVEAAVASLRYIVDHPDEYEEVSE